MRIRPFRPVRPDRRYDRGQALAEFALVIPMLLAVLLGTVEFARAWQIHQVVTNTAREGARIGVLASTTNNGMVEAAMDNYLTSASVNMSKVTYAISFCGGVDQNQVTVTYDYTYTLFGPVLKLLSGGSAPASVSLSSTSIMRCE